MKIRKNTTYYVDNCVVRVKILSIAYESDSIIKAKLALIYDCGTLIERPKHYRLHKKNISHWKILKNCPEH